MVRSRIDPAKLPYAGNASGCEPVFPHQYIRANTIFEVAHAAGAHTAWSDKHLAYELVTGPSGDGVDDFFAPEINSVATNLVPKQVAPTILEALGLDARELEGVRKEGTEVLPGLFR